MKTVFIVMDSLNRHLLSAYGHSGVHTPNIDRLAQRGITFDTHYCGSLPCMPARREMMTGRHNFLETPWSAIQPWDRCLPTILREERGTYSHLITDHYHYFHSGGEGYHTLFDSYEFERGQESDGWRPLVEAPKPPERGPDKGGRIRFYSANRTHMDVEADESYPTPRCFIHALDFLERNHAADNWHLQLELFDPHEPFDCPSRYLELYGDTWKRGRYSWPDYLPLDPSVDDAQSVRHIRNCYAGTLTMADAWLGKFLDKLDQFNLWEDVTLVFTTDHGHLLGEHGYWAKNYMLDYEELVHIPMIVCAPGARPRRERAMTTTIDLVPTFLELHGAPMPDTVQGKSLLPLLRDDGAQPVDRLHDALLYGYFGKDIGMFDGRYSYCRQPLPESITHHHTAMPRAFWDFIDDSTLAAAEHGTFLASCRGISHFRIPVPSHRHHNAPDYNPIYDVVDDPGQKKPLRDQALESRLATKMRELLLRYDAPECQFTRTGLDR